MNLLPALNFLLYEAGKVILDFYQKPILVEMKANHTPVTEADLAAHHFIVKGLENLTPQYPVLSEESAILPFEERAKWECFWLLDPLDGTKEFIEKTGEFTINLALIEKHEPILGIVYAPILGELFYAVRGKGAFKLEKEAIRTVLENKARDDFFNSAWRIQTARLIEAQKIKIIVSRRHNPSRLETLLAKFPPYELLVAGSALKFGRVAEGYADVYPRFGPTSEWDTAAGQCVVEEAGGCVVDLFGQPLRYNTRENLEQAGFMAVGRKENLNLFKENFHE